MNYDLSYLMDKESASAQNPHKKLTCIWPSLRLFVSLRSEKKLGHTHNISQPTNKAKNTRYAFVMHLLHCSEN
jgi:hypothetical protein